jgi:hypothetical protein
LAARLQAAVLADSAGSVVVASLQAFGLIVVPLVLLYWPEATTLRLAALSPVMGFVALLPPSASLSPGVLAPPWWLSPALNLATAALLRGTRNAPLGTGTIAAPAGRQSHDGLLSRGAEWVAARWDQPVLVKELRAGARRGDWRRLLAQAGTASLVLAVPELFLPNFITGVATAIPLRFFPSDLPDLRLFFASMLAVILMVLTWLMLFSAPVSGAAAFAQERRKGTLGFLLATPLGENEIVRGKLLSVLAPLLLTLALTFPVAGLAALLSLSLTVLWSFVFSYAWLLIACLTGGAFGVLVSLLLPDRTDRQALPLMAVLTLQTVKLYAVARLQYYLTGASWLNSKMEITAWYVVPLVALEAGVGLLAYAAGVACLARSRRRDLRSVAEK